MSKDIKYSSDNLFDIKNLRQNLYRQIEECNIQKRILDGQIDKLTEVVNALDRHIFTIEDANKKEEEEND